MLFWVDAIVVSFGLRVCNNANSTCNIFFVCFSSSRNRDAFLYLNGCPSRRRCLKDARVPDADRSVSRSG